MIRLSSYTVYSAICFVPGPLVIVIALWDLIKTGNGLAVFILTAALALSIFSLFWLSRNRRVYLDGEKLYLYKLFSNQKMVLSKDHVLLFEWVWPGRLVISDSGVWRIDYLDANDNKKSVLFTKSWFCSEFRSIVDWYNEC